MNLERVERARCERANHKETFKIRCESTRSHLSKEENCIAEWPMCIDLQHYQLIIIQ